MDFFERQDKARRNTKWLVAYFVAGVLSLIAVVHLAVCLVFAGVGDQHRRDVYGYSGRNAFSLWNPQLLVGSAIGTLAVVLLGSAYKTAELSGGGSKVAEMLGGVPVNANTTDPQERRLLNVVEEMAIASGVPVPRVFILPQEGGINAFAAGHSNSDAVIGVTRGAVRILNRDELQGVIGHEFSHILNGDMRLNIQLMGYVFGILCLALVGRILLQTRGRKNPLPLLGLALILTGWIGVFFGRLIQSAVSRQREFLADASSVQFTRNPDGLASALKKIGGLAQGSRLTSPQAAEASHMFFGNGMRSSFLGLMSTHPPLEQRIRALDPGFDGKFPAVTGFASPPAARGDSSSHAAENVSSAGFVVAPPGPAPRLVDSIGSPQPAHLRYAEHLRASVPPHLAEAARETTGAIALVYAMLLSDDVQVRAAQMKELDGITSEFIRSETLRLLPAAREVAVRARLPVVDLVLPALRQLSPAQFQQFRTGVDKLVEADGEIDLFEYMLQKIIMRHLEPAFVGLRKSVVQYYSLKGLTEDCAVLLSALAHLGSPSEAEAQTAFARGAEPLAYAAGLTPPDRLSIVPPETCGLDMADKALERLSQAAPQIKKNLLNACAMTVASDGVIKEAEAELLRAIADSLDCPMPPLLETA